MPAGSSSRRAHGPAVTTTTGSSSSSSDSIRRPVSIRSPRANALSARSAKTTPASGWKSTDASASGTTPNRASVSSLVSSSQAALHARSASCELWTPSRYSWSRPLSRSSSSPLCRSSSRQPSSASCAKRTHFSSGYASRKIRVRPWLEPRAWPSSNCSYATTSTPSRRRAQAVASPFSPAPTTATSATARPDGVPQHADSRHLQLDHVARLQPAPVAELEDAARPDRPRSEHVAGQQPRVPRRVLDDPLPGEVQVRELAAGALLTVHARDHHGTGAVELVGRDHDRAERRREVLALRRPEADLHLRALEVAGRPVVHHGEAA